MMSHRTALREAARDNSGRFTKNPCYCCGAPAPMDACSHNMTDCTDAEGHRWMDIALVLCKKCANATANMTLVSEYIAYKRELGVAA